MTEDWPATRCSVRLYFLRIGHPSGIPSRYQQFQWRKGTFLDQCHDHEQRFSRSFFESVVRSNTSHPGPLLSSIYLFNFRLKIPNISPSPFLNCALHPVCCKVVHVSGATKHVEKVRQDTDRMGVLASSDILSFKSLSLASVDVEG